MLVRLRFWIILALNIFLVCASLVSAWLLRFEFTLPQRRILLTALPILLVMRVTALARFNLLHGYWRYTGLSDVTDILKATALSTAAFLVVERFLLGIVAFPKSIYLLEALLAVGLLCGIRLVSRTLLQVAARQFMKHSQKEGDCCRRGDAPLRDCSRTCRIADIPARSPWWTMIARNSERVFMVRQCWAPSMTCLGWSSWMTSRRFSSQSRRRRGPKCDASRCVRAFAGALPYNSCPCRSDQWQGHRRAVARRRRELAWREPVRLDLEPVRQQLADKVVMVTGAAGSIGSELCRQLLYYEPRKLLCVDQDESGLFFLDQRLRQECPTGTLEYRVADVADSHCMRRLISGAEVDIIFSTRRLTSMSR